jgi:hypothetical protein
MPGELHSRRFSSVSALLNVVSRTTHPLSISLLFLLQGFNLV